MNVDEAEHDHEALRGAALALTCPRCGMPPLASCKWHGRFGTSLHPERLSLANGGPAKDDLPAVPWRSPRSPDFRFRRIDEDGAVSAERRIAGSQSNPRIGGPARP